MKCLPRFGDDEVNLKLSFSMEFESDGANSSFPAHLSKDMVTTSFKDV